MKKKIRKNVFILIYLISYLSFTQVKVANEYYEDYQNNIESENYQAAKESIEFAIKLDKSNTNYKYCKAKTLILLKEFNSCEIYLNKFSKKEKNTINWILIYSELLNFIGKSEKAREILNSEYKKSKIYELKERICLNYNDKEEYEEAVKCFNNLAKLKPNNKLNYQNLILLNILLKKEENCIKSLDEFLKLSENKEQILKELYNISVNNNLIKVGLYCINRIIEIDSNNLDNYLRKIEVLDTLNDTKGVYEVYLKLNSIEPCNIDYLEKIIEYENRNNLKFDSFNHLTEQMICENKKEDLLNIEVNKFIINLYSDNSKIAENQIDSVLLKHPNDLDAIYFKGICLFNRNELEKSLYYFKRMQELDKMNSQNLVTTCIYIIEYELYGNCEIYELFNQNKKESQGTGLFKSEVSNTNKKTKRLIRFNKELMGEELFYDLSFEDYSVLRKKCNK
ncbi:tetratricopeptide repeat protein [Aureivirga sp. CE67]|uniref:tetratricopeptide repeat protein n=1 Tax=Aureivirga sp. CE67 TaxID=1788983 RepID=UPI0018CA8164|nr:hypothetical protein [Aureivirga sp. CE67]